MLFSLRRALAALSLAAFAACAPIDGKAPEASAQSEAAVFEALEVATANGPVRLQVEIADTEAERSRGLMFRAFLADDRGMLFDFKPARPVAFWMKNTWIPLDIIFIAPDGRILNIAEKTTPYSEAPIPSAGVTRAVLEIRGGRARELGIAPGDKVAHRIFPK